MEVETIFEFTEPTGRYSPDLAREIGMNESLFLLQLDSWTSTLEHIMDEKSWTCQSTKDIQKKLFPFHSISTINRTIHSLQDLGLINVSSQYNHSKYDKTRWFALDFEAIGKLKSIGVTTDNESSISLVDE